MRFFTIGHLYFKFIPAFFDLLTFFCKAYADLRDFNLDVVDLELEGCERVFFLAFEGFKLLADVPVLRAELRVLLIDFVFVSLSHKFSERLSCP